MRLRRGHTLHEGVDGQGKPESLHGCGCRWKGCRVSDDPQNWQEGEVPRPLSSKLQETRGVAPISPRGE